MKKEIEQLNVEKVLKNYPIIDLVENWYFRVEEISQGHYIAEGTDLFNRRVFYSSGDDNEALSKCKEYAIEINKQIQSKND